jgi:protein disulfide-isomerase
MAHSRLFCTAVVAVLGFSTTLCAEGVRWQTNIEQARKLAAESDRLVLLHFYGSNCAPCMKLERNVFPLPQFAATLEANYVPVKIFADINEDLVKQYNIRSWPTDVVMTPDGKVLHTGGCPQDPREYTQLLYQVSNDYRRAHPAAAIARNDVPARNDAAAREGGPASAAAVSSQRVAYDANQGDSRNNGAQRNIQRDVAPPAVAAVTARAVETEQPNAGLERHYAEDEAANAATSAYTNPAPQAGSAERPAAAVAGERNAPTASATNPATKMIASSVPSKPADRNALPYGDILPKAAAPVQPPVAATAGAPLQGSPIASSSTAGDVSKASAVEAAPTLCLDGCCPVTIKETRKWVAGDQRWGAVHRGRIYLFANEAAQQRFLIDPDSYTPAASGNDAVAWVDQGRLVPGVRKFGGYFRGQVYLFSSEESLQQFQRNSDRYAFVIEQAMAASRSNSVRR